MTTQVGCYLNSHITALGSSSTSDESTTPISEEPSVVPLNPASIFVDKVSAQQVQLNLDPGSNISATYKVSLSLATAPDEHCEANVVNVSSNDTIDITTLTPDTTYYFRVCSTNGNKTSTGVIGTFKTLKLITRAPAYPSYSNWNDYLVNNGAKFYNANQSVCVPATNYGFNACINGALVQKIVITGINDCSRLKASDQLNAFRWACDPSGSDAIIYSTDFNRHKGLSDLILDNQFRDNTVIVKVDGQNVYSTANEKWWTNVIESLPISPNGTTTTLTNSGQPSGKIFTVSADRISGAYSIAEDKISIVVLKNAKLIKDPTTTTNLITAVATTKFLWYEGSFSGNNQSANIILMPASQHCRLQNIELAYSTDTLVDFGYDTHSNKLIDFTFHHGVYGFDSSSSSSSLFNLLLYGNVSNMQGAGIRYISHSVVSNVVFSANTGSRGAVSYGFNTIYMNLTFVNNSLDNSIYNFAANADLFNNMLSVNSGTQAALYNYQARAHIFSQLMLIGGGTQDILNSNTRAPLKFTNNLVIENAARCTIYNDTAWSPGLLTDGSCGNAGPSNAILRLLSFDQPKMFVGKVLTSDLINSEDTLGSGNASSLTNWSRFDNNFRAWGKEGSIFPNTDNKGPCATGNCRIWDFRLKADPANIAYNSTDAVATKNDPFIPGATCPAAVHGNKKTDYTDYYSVTTPFLTNAVEISLDGLGNDNVMCESGESCLYSPNFGAYQGEGDYEAAGTCIFQAGAITGVKLYAYPTNGI